MKKQQEYWTPSQHLGMAWMLRHQAPQLVGRLSRPQKKSLQAAIRVSAAAAKRGQKVGAAKPPQLPKGANSLLPTPQAQAPTPQAKTFPRAPPPVGKALPAVPREGSLPPPAPNPLKGLAAKPPAQLQPSLPRLPPKLP